jgi:anti-sigma regulatory factor (Ser/Thr protein kinase)
MHKLDSAFFYNQKAAYIADTGHNQQYMIDYAIRVFADIYAEKGEKQLALKYYNQFISDFYKYNLNNREIGHVYFGVAKLYQEEKEIDSSILYAEKALASGKIYSDQEHIFNSSHLLYHLYDSLQIENKAYRYYKISIDAKENMAIRQAQNLAFNEQIREKEKLEVEIKKAAETKLMIIISALIVAIVTFLLWNRIRQLRLKHKMILEQKETEKLKTKYEKDLLTLEAKALRAQMNPHFIFNSMNSIKSLINKNENEKAANYLTTFSKLIRTLFQNSDKREVSLYEEIETCKLYTQLERMRFGDNIKFIFNVDETIDLKDIKVPALILQPLIENAIWHGLVPKETGGTIVFSIKETDGTVECVIDDDGIGRELSNQYKAQYRATHESKGIGMTQSRLELDKLLNEREDTIQLIDKKNANDIAAGTKVIITFKEK